jgi:hypothetical protein
MRSAFCLASGGSTRRLPVRLGLVKSRIEGGYASWYDFVQTLWGAKPCASPGDSQQDSIHAGIAALPLLHSRPG